jgi:hypothetical protein
MLTIVVRFVLAIAVLLDPSFGVARKRQGAKSKANLAAVFLLPKGKPDPKLHAAFAAEFFKTPSRAKALKVLFGRQLRKALKRRPEAAINQCGASIECIAELGEKVHAQHVIYGRIAPAGQGINVQFVVVNVAAQSVDSKLRLEIASVTDIKSQLAANNEALFPDSAPAVRASAEEIPLDTVLSGEAASDALLADESVAEPELLARPRFNLLADEAAADTLTEGTPVSNDVASVDVDRLMSEKREAEIAAIAPEVLITTTEPSESADSLVLTYAGIGVAGLGLTGLATGGYLGMTAKSTLNSIKYCNSATAADCPNATTQNEALAKQKEAKETARLANLSYAVGGGLVAIGATLILLDLLVFDGGAPDAAVSVGEAGAAATLEWAW